MDRSGRFSCHFLRTNKLRDSSGIIQPRLIHPSFFDPQRLWPSKFGIQYLLPIFTDAVGADDVEQLRPWFSAQAT